MNTRRKHRTPVVRRTVRRTGLAATAVATALVASACGSGFEDSGSGGGGESDGISVLIGSSGDAETEAVRQAVAAWSEESGVEASVDVAADLPQQLSQGFAAGSPPDVFYVSTDALAGYAANGSLLAYGDQLDASQFYPNLVDAFTVDDQLQCAPKDFSTLALVINTQLWEQAGLTDADVPTTWEELQEVADTLTQGDVTGLSFSAEYARVGAFFPQAGGAMVEGDQAVVDSPENNEALTYVQSLLDSGSAAYASTLGAGWGGEAFGTQQAAMTIEGSWIAGAMSNDYPDVGYTIAPLPEGPAGAGTLAFTNCWGIAEASPDQEDAVALVRALTSTEQQLAFARAFGVIPSTEAAAEQYKTEKPEWAPFIDAADVAQVPPNQEGAADVIGDFNAQLETLADGDPAQVLASIQDELQAVLDADQAS